MLQKVNINISNITKWLENVNLNTNEINIIFQSVFKTKQTPWRIQWLLCSAVNKSASNTSPTPMAFLRRDVVYTGVLRVFCSFKRWASIGITLKTGRGSTNTFGRERLRQPFSKSHPAPSKYKPVTRQVP